MNTYTRNLKAGNGEISSRSGAASSGKGYFAWFAVRISIICMLIFCAVACRIHLSAKTERLNKSATRIRAQIKEVNIQIYNERSRREALTAWPYISHRIQMCKLGLREADYRQISYLKLQDRPGIMNKVLRNAYANKNAEKKIRVYAQLNN